MNRLINCLRITLSYFSFLLMGLGGDAIAQSLVLDLPDGRCVVQETISVLHFQSVERRAAIAKQMLPVVENLRVLSEKTKDPSKSVGSQLSMEDRDKFSRLSQQIQTMQLTSLMESRRIRDLEAIERMAIISDQEYRWSKLPKEQTDDYIFYSAFKLLNLTGNLSLSEPKTAQCTLEFALHKLASESLAKITPILGQVSEASGFYKSLMGKYKFETIDRKKLNASDRAKYDDYENKVMIFFRKNYTHIQDIEAIKLLAKSLELMHQANLQDVAIGGGSFDAIGQTIQRNINNKNYDEATQLAMGIWTKVNEKIPSQDVQDWQKLNSK